MQDFRNIKVWNESHQLTLKVYEITSEFPKSEMFNLTSQLRRACVSIPNNIAEGCGRNSDKDFLPFLHISLGSTNETLYLLILSKDLKLITEEIFKEFEDKVEKIKAMLLAFIKTINNRLA
ncbi:four helix bundle protein [Empedobacter falsenii]|uniref:four helix bundle protein n=1 Tax=Empedobacter TaxID=59734 RepID=UPI002576575B|nr:MULTISPECIES: four helix bundle protein [Empedobacter]MDM1042528.1 four helix bundle protein [Empedobacter brevis]MDM1136458.1 four helix bundle protein [Empedobacter sp. R750]